MAFDDFNTITAKKHYIYRQNPVHQQSFMILKQLSEEGAYQPVRDYTVLYSEEEHSLSEKKVMNLVALMNDEDHLIDIGSGSVKRMDYLRGSTDSRDKKRIIFYVMGKLGVSK
ncbi:MAG: hypothetical protein VXY16_03690 [Pseudomonadota bacterium]|nr:hypothetical protein [Pseudomonadota bacterium]